MEPPFQAAAALTKPAAQGFARRIDTEIHKRAIIEDINVRISFFEVRALLGTILATNRAYRQKHGSAKSGDTRLRSHIVNIDLASTIVRARSKKRCLARIERRHTQFESRDPLPGGYASDPAPS